MENIGEPYCGAIAPGLSSIVTNQDGSPNSQDNPAQRNGIITLYGTGEGLTDEPNIAGLSAAGPYPKPKLPVTLTMAGVSADILYAGRRQPSWECCKSTLVSPAVLFHRGKPRCS